MKRKLATTLAIAALAPFGVAACGDDEEETPSSPPPETSQTDDGDAGGKDTGGSGESTLELSADPGGALAYEQDSAVATAGQIAIRFTNESSTPHDVRVEGSGEDLGGTETVTGDNAGATVELEAGDYTFYCSVPGHREAGMEGTLTVK